MLILVSPPDAHGYVSLGVSVDIVRAAVDSAKLVIAEVNPRMPRTLGDSFLHVPRITKLVPVDTPIYEHPVEPLDDVSLAVGRHVATATRAGTSARSSARSMWSKHPRSTFRLAAIQSIVAQVELR
jgi:4-hydroxybutyrate CoA-transferase